MGAGLLAGPVLLLGLVGMCGWLSAWRSARTVRILLRQIASYEALQAAQEKLVAGLRTNLLLKDKLLLRKDEHIAALSRRSA